MFSLGLFLFASHCLFSPPPKWEIADPKIPSKRALVGFVDKSRSGFCPSIHLTQEKVIIPVKEYLATVQKNCTSKKQQWKHLGTISTKNGAAELIEIEMQTKFGPARLLQAILFDKQDAHILTSGVLKKDFGKYAPVIQKSLCSMTIHEDLFELIEDEKIRNDLKLAWQKKKNALESISFDKMVLELKKLGPVWQVLMLKL